MKKSDLFLNIAISVLFVAIVVVVLFKYVIRDDSHLFHIENLNIISVAELDGKVVPLIDLVDKNGDTYCLIFELNNCYSCIVNGLEDLKKLQAAGAKCIAIVVHDYIEEVNGWSKNHDFSHFYIIKKIDFFKTIHSSVLPVVFRIKDGKVKNFKFITP